MPRQSLSDDYRPDAKIFGEQVRRRRERRGWTQEEMVARMGGAISRNHLQDIERGVKLGIDGRPTNPQLSTFIALASVLGARIIIDVNRPGFAVRFDPSVPHELDPRR